MSPVPAATTTVEDHTSETLARRLRAHLQALAPLRLPITLYVGGQFIGGCDIVREMNASGNLQKIDSLKTRNALRATSA